ncbi:MAG: amino acid permease [Acidobacteria bacterium]|nr:amino acid permease [Acidobacteriota bacterium]
MGEVGLPRRLGLLDAISIVSGTIIGSGIFLVPNLVARQLTSPVTIFACWVFAGLLSLAGALAYAELGAMRPRSGGQYAWLYEAYGPVAAFLCGWTYFLVVMTAAVAWLAVTFGTYLSYLVPLSNGGRLAAGLALIAVLTTVNCLGVVLGAGVQKVFTLLKLSGLALLVATAFASPVNHFGDAGPADWSVSHFGAAMLACVLTYDGWVVLSMVAGEVKEPNRNLPRGLAGGLGICIAMYLLANAAYMKILPVAEIAKAERVAAQVAEGTIGPGGGTVVAIIILLSIVGGMNGWMLSGPRIYYAQARDGLLFPRFATVHPRFLTPVFSIVAQGVWAALLCVTGTYESLAALAMFAAWAFYAATVFAVIVLRRRLPEAERPYRMWGYPVLPVVFCLLAMGFVVNTLVTQPGPSFAALGLMAAGLPAYAYWRKGGLRR